MKNNGNYLYMVLQQLCQLDLLLTCTSFVATHHSYQNHRITEC